MDSWRSWLRKKVHKLLPLKCLLDTIPISSSERERGFSQMTLKVTHTWAPLLTDTILALLLIRLVAYFLIYFDLTKYVQSCLFYGWHSVADMKSKQHNQHRTQLQTWYKSGTSIFCNFISWSTSTFRTETIWTQ